VIKNKNTFIQSCLLLIAFLLSSGCATVDGVHNPDDPYEGFNRSMFSFNEGLDKYIAKPLAEGYNTVMPEPASKGVTNFFRNLDDILVFINEILQWKIAAAVETSARFVFNSTIGLLGLIDVASDMNLPKHNEDIGQTLAVWGVPSGPYMVLPILGPSNVRYTGGKIVQWIYYNDPVLRNQSLKTRLAILALKYTDIRAGLIKTTNIIDDTAPDKYAFIRDAWKQRREFLIYDGNPPEEYDIDGLFNEDELFSDDDLFEMDVLDKKALQEDSMKSNMQIMNIQLKPAEEQPEGDKK
jgi:phospholipid-binding lipoprotein MlaA